MWGAAVEKPTMLARDRQFRILNTHTHRPSHSPSHVCTRSPTQPLPPPSSSTKLVLWSPSLLGPIKNGQDKSITSSTRTRPSSLLLPPVNHSSLPSQTVISHGGRTVRFSIPAPGVRVLASTSKGLPIMVQLVLLSSVCLSFESRYASVSLRRYAATHD